MNNELDADELHQLRCDRNRFVAEHVMRWEFNENPHGWRLWFPHGRANAGSIEDDNLPDFFNSRDACAQAEAKIAEMGLRCDFVDALFAVVMPDAEEDEFNTTLGRFKTATASARERCEAMYAIREHIVKGIKQ